MIQLLAFQSRYSSNHSRVSRCFHCIVPLFWVRKAFTLIIMSRNQFGFGLYGGGAFVAEDGGVLDNSIQIRRAFLICNDVNTYGDDCANSIRDAFKSCLMKLIYLFLVNKGHYKPSLVLFAFYILFYLFQNGK